MLEARRIAHTVLVRVEKGGAFANRALDATLSESGQLDPRDAALATELTYGTLRRQIFIDHALAHFSKRPIPELDFETRALLRMGAHQILHLRLPERAAVHETVELAKEIRNGWSVGYVNAVLRALIRERANVLIPPATVDPVGHLSLTESFPRWLIESMLKSRDFEQTRAFLAGLNHSAPLTVRVNARRGDRHAAQHEIKSRTGLDSTPTRYSPVGLMLETGRSSLELLRPGDGRWQAQDEAAQLVGIYADPRPGMAVLDSCAAPGGKTCHMAELMEDRGRLDAFDVHSKKIVDVQSGARALGLSIVNARAGDATQPLPDAPVDGYDLAVVDAPCSGLGTIRRHPELKTRRLPEDIGRLARLQAQLLDQVARYVKRGGHLVYAVCTFTEEEGAQQVAAFLSKHPEYSRAPAPQNLDWGELANAQGDLVTDPGRHGTDAFYAARLVRD